MKQRLLALGVSFCLPLVAAAANPLTTFPGGCVDCHIKDNRVSTLLARWNGKVDAKTLAAMQAFVPKGITLKGKHPPVPGKDIPASCKKCHSGTSKTIPPLAPLLHGIHLAKTPNEFVAKFGGECTHCHKLNKTNGTWSMPSGAEK